jgi:hypothetical protein
MPVRRSKSVGPGAGQLPSHYSDTPGTSQVYWESTVVERICSHRDIPQRERVLFICTRSRGVMHVS